MDSAVEWLRSSRLRLLASLPSDEQRLRNLIADAESARRSIVSTRRRIDDIEEVLTTIGAPFVEEEPTDA